MGWLSYQVQRTLADWLGADHSRDEAEALADAAVRWKRSTLDGDQLTNVLSIRELLDEVEVTWGYPPEPD
jgi:hypothetical protein